jgi:hypothetical protein
MEICEKVPLINHETLEAALRRCLKTDYRGYSTGGGSVRVFIADDCPPQRQQAVRQLLRTYNPHRLSPRQQALLDDRQRLRALRQRHAQPLPPQPDLATLAERVRWLEEEIRHLRRQPPD